MKLVPYKKEDLKIRGQYRMGRKQAIVMEFANSDIDCAKVEGFTGSAYNAQQSLRRATIRLGLHHIKAMSSKGEVYLIKIDI